MKLTTNLQFDTKLAEIDQVNALLWAIGKEGQESLQRLTPWFKCKDFFNDVAASFISKRAITIHGFRSDYEKLGMEAWKTYVPVIVTNTHTSFEDNVTSVLNPFLHMQGFPLIEIAPVEEESTYLLKIPVKYLQNSFFISNLTLLIRCCNYKTIDSLEEWVALLEKCGACVDAQFLKLALTDKKLQNFNEKAYKNVFYKKMCPWNGAHIEYKDLPNAGVGTIHNGGFINWSI